MTFEHPRSYIATLTRSERQAAIDLLIEIQGNTDIDVLDWKHPFRAKPSLACLIVWMFFDWTLLAKYFRHRKLFGAGIPEKAYEAFWQEWQFSAWQPGMTERDLVEICWMAFLDALIRHYKAADRVPLTI